MTLEIDDDYLMFDGTESVTLTLRRVSGDVEVSIANALRQPMTRRFAQAGGVSIEEADTVFSVPDAQLNPSGNGRRVQSLDLVEDAAGVVYVVIQAMQATLRTRWDLICNRKL